MRIDLAVLIAGALIAAAITFAGLGQRYAVAYSGTSVAARIDRLTGEVAGCAPRAEQLPSGLAVRFDCSGDLH